VLTAAAKPPPARRARTRAGADAVCDLAHEPLDLEPLPGAAALDGLLGRAQQSGAVLGVLGHEVLRSGTDQPDRRDVAAAGQREDRHLRLRREHALDA
jgi:hypothetical protein